MYIHSNYRYTTATMMLDSFGVISFQENGHPRVFDLFSYIVNVVSSAIICFEKEDPL